VILVFWKGNFNSSGRNKGFRLIDTGESPTQREQDEQRLREVFGSDDETEKDPTYEPQREEEEQQVLEWLIQ